MALDAWCRDPLGSGREANAAETHVVVEAKARAEVEAPVHASAAVAEKETAEVRWKDLPKVNASVAKS